MAVATTYAYRDRVVQAVGTDRFLVGVSDLTDIGLQWVSHQAAGISTSVTVYGTLEQDPAKLTNLNPSTNGLWFELPANFADFPDGSIKSSILSIANDTHAHLMIEIVTTVEIPQFSFLVRGKKR
jgi:hypothetical protein